MTSICACMTCNGYIHLRRNTHELDKLGHGKGHGVKIQNKDLHL